MKRSVAIYLLAASAVALSGCGGAAAATADAPAATTAKPDPETLMFEACTEAVLAHLKAPATAQFPDASTATYKKPDPSCRQQTRVMSYVDAENGFGALIRSEWGCSVSLSPDGSEVTGVGPIAIDGTPYNS
jgi:hypothetical protein